MTDTEAPEPKVFTYAEAVKLLPQVRLITETAFEKVQHLSEAAQIGTQNEDDAQRLADGVVSGWARELTELGVAIKGLWLADFDNGSGYYCWKYPESGLRFFHTYEGGFKSRIPIQ